MRVLVTGASGFLGRHAVTRLIAAGHETIAAARTKPNGATAVDWRLCDLLAPGEAARLVWETKPDAVLHLAWTASPGQFWTDPANLDWIGASLALARAAREVGARRFCGAGTCFEYDWPAQGDCRELATPLGAHTLYDAAKDACRRALEAYARQAGLSFAWARLFYFYGPDEHPDRLVASVARALAAGRPARCSSGLAVRDYMDARDAGAALAALVVSPVEGPVNVGSGRGVGIADLARTLGALAGRPELVQLGALPDRADEPPRIVADVGRLTREVGFSPQVALEDGLRAALDDARRRRSNA